jgi:hypothetical protein
MNIINVVYIKVAILSQVIDRFITVMNIKYCNRLSSKIISVQIIILNM